MKTFFKVCLWLWSIFMIISGLVTIIGTSGVVSSTPFNLQIAILHKMGVFLVWVALFSMWKISETQQTEHEQVD